MTAGSEVRIFAQLGSAISTRSVSRRPRPLRLLHAASAACVHHARVSTRLRAYETGSTHDWNCCGPQRTSCAASGRLMPWRPLPPPRERYTRYCWWWRVGSEEALSAL